METGREIKNQMEDIRFEVLIAVPRAVLSSGM
jgi:hypothetical protein